MSDDPEEPLSLLGRPGDSVNDVDANDLKRFWQQMSKLQAKVSGQHFVFTRGNR